MQEKERKKGIALKGKTTKYKNYEHKEKWTQGGNEGTPQNGKIKRDKNKTNTNTTQQKESEADQNQKSMRQPAWVPNATTKRSIAVAFITSYHKDESFGRA